MSLLDLHTHSTASDGHLTPTELVTHAAAQGVATLALSDHDTLAGLEEAQAAATAAGLRFLPAVELTVQVPHGSMHMLAYLPTPASPVLAECLERVTELRTARIAQVVERLGELGMPVEWSRVRERAAGQLGRPHVAHAMVEAGHCASVQEAFDRWLADNRPAHVSQRGLEPAEALALVRDAGGAAVLAHPASLRLPQRHLESFVQSLAARGLAGLEVHRPEHTPDQRDRFQRIARRLKLIPAGGSDFHTIEGPYRLGDTGMPSLPAESADRIADAFR